MDKNLQIRKKLVSSCKRIVIKAGTRLLTDHEALAILIRQIKSVRDAGIQVLLVSSGAVGTGMRSMNLTKRPRKLSEVQALAAIGQIHLMSIYEAECEKLGFKAAQILLTAEDLRSRERHLNALNCIETLLAHGILPIINENDPVSVDELKFGDNDILAALLASMTRSDLAIILTTVDGLMKPNPDGTLGERIPLVEGVTDEQRAMANGTDDSSMSIGGMKSKLRCADILNSAGECLWIASGKDIHVIEKIFRGEDVGTVFVPRKKVKVGARKRWLASFAKSSGKIIIDQGAVNALLAHGGSLLPAGMKFVQGSFKRGSIVEICSAEGEVIAKGLTNFSSEDCMKLIGCQSAEIHEILDSDADHEIVHRNNMALLKLN